MNRTVLGVILVAIIAGVLIMLFSGKSQNLTTNTVEQVPTEDPIDVTSTFMNAWLDNLATSSPVSLSDFIATQTNVADALKSKLTTATGDLDPITCQLSVPDRVGAKEVFVTNTSAQLMVLARGGPKTPEQAIVTLEAQDGEWVIADLDCVMAESGGPIGEFTFEQAGQLVRESLPDQYDKTTWHLIFTKEDDSIGVVPLFLDTESQCVNAETAAPCDAGQFEEGRAVLVKANMLEAGAGVKVVEFK